MRLYTKLTFNGEILQVGSGGVFVLIAENTRLEMTTDLREKDLHILKDTSLKQQENPADFSSVHKVQDFFAQICCHFPPSQCFIGPKKWKKK